MKRSDYFSFQIRQEWSVKIYKFTENFHEMGKVWCNTRFNVVCFDSDKLLKLLLLLSLSTLLPFTQGAYRYSLDSCTDLHPRQVSDPLQNNDHYYHQSPPSWRTRNKRSEGYGSDQPPPPVQVTVPGKRYRKNSDLNVQIEGKGHYEALMLQARVVGPSGEFIPGGVGLIGRFDPRHIRRNNFSYLECFRQPYGTIVDTGNAQRLGNITFTWTAPDSDLGSIQFLAGITNGIYFWIIVSSILHFNPFPISTLQCGGAEACFRVCPLDTVDGRCGANNALVMYTYNTDLTNKQDVEFTLGGNLNLNHAYLAVVYAEDNDNLYQADVTVCYVERGKPQIVHLRLEVTGASLQHHPEEIALEDYDIDGNMLWCRYRRPISRTSLINPWKSFYTLLYKGDLDLTRYPRFQTPTRSNMYSADMKFNLTTPVNKIYSGSQRIMYISSGFAATMLTVIVITLFVSN